MFDISVKAAVTLQEKPRRNFKVIFFVLVYFWKKKKKVSEFKVENMENGERGVGLRVFSRHHYFLKRVL